MTISQGLIHFNQRLAENGVSIVRRGVETLQVNMGKLCNQGLISGASPRKFARQSNWHSTSGRSSITCMDEALPPKAGVTSPRTRWVTAPNSTRCRSMLPEPKNYLLHRTREIQV